MRSLLELVLKDIPGIKLSGLARNGSEARLILSRHRPQLVLLDEILPGESSYDLLKEVHQQGIPVILITSLENETDKTKDGLRPLPSEAVFRMSKPGWKSVEDDRDRMGKLIFKYAQICQDHRED